MKSKKVVGLIAVGLFLVAGVKLVEVKQPVHEEPMEVINSYVQQSKEEYSQRISIVLNQEEELDVVLLGSEIIDEFILNELEGVLFSFEENGYPSTLQVSVSKTMEEYTNCETYCKIVYEKISDNPVCYSMKIQEIS